MVLDTLVSTVIKDHSGDITSLLCIATSKVDMLLNYYHPFIVETHIGINKCYMMISQRFYFLNLAPHLRTCITECHICQMFKEGKSPTDHFRKE